MKTKLSGEIKIDAYAVFSDALENAIAYGIRRYFKHRNAPTDLDLEQMAEEVSNTVLNDLTSLLNFD